MKPARQVAFITGGLSGIGLAAAIKMLERGVAVCVASTRAKTSTTKNAQDRIEAVASKTQTDCLICQLDVRNPSSIDQTVSAIDHELGPISILVNAAGVYSHQPISSHDYEIWNGTLGINLTGPFLVTRAVWPQMLKAGRGRIINIASTASHTGAENYAAYCASKAGLLGLTRVTALEGAKVGILANSISPSWVDTPMMAASMEHQAKISSKSASSIYEEVKSSNPQDRVISPEEIAQQIIWLALDAPRAITGEDILMTGGATW